MMWLAAWVLGSQTLTQSSTPSAPAEILTSTTYSQIKSHVLPKPQEIQFQEVPWRATLWEAIVEGQRQNRPILLWAMNGHPLGCT